MNSTTLKLAVYFTAGIVIGGVGGYFAGRLIAQRIQKQAIDDFLSDFESENIVVEGEEDGDKEEEDDDGKIEIEKSKDFVDYTAISSKYGSLTPRPDLYSVASSLMHEPSPPIDKEDVDKKYPYLINSDDFNDELSGQARVHLCYYYKGGDVVLTYLDEDEPIDNGKTLLGADFDKKFGQESGDRDVVYIRNESNSTDYEVIRIHDRYKEANAVQEDAGVLGGKTLVKPKTSKASRSRRQVKVDEQDISEEEG